MKATPCLVPALVSALVPGLVVVTLGTLAGAVVTSLAAVALSGCSDNPIYLCPDQSHPCDEPEAGTPAGPDAGDDAGP